MKCKVCGIVFADNTATDVSALRDHLEGHSSIAHQFSTEEVLEEFQCTDKQT